tara:strand:- start:466 stop:630 length:165 start_codon:yes stop_codon:yes gene_type:complete
MRMTFLGMSEKHVSNPFSLSQLKTRNVVLLLASAISEMYGCVEKLPGTKKTCIT